MVAARSSSLTPTNTDTTGYAPTGYAPSGSTVYSSPVPSSLVCYKKRTMHIVFAVAHTSINMCEYT